MADRQNDQLTIQAKRKLFNTAKLEIQITLFNNKLYIRGLGSRVFKNPRCHRKVLGPRKMTRFQFHTENP
jgi:hypothetical protein